jgi:hypothetical protein
MGKTGLQDCFAGLAAATGASVPDDFYGQRRLVDAIGLLGVLARR